MTDDDIDKYFNEKFNKQSKESRSEIIPYTIQEQMNQLKREKLRLKRSCDRDVKEINGHLANLRKGLRGYYFEQHK